MLFSQDGKLLISGSGDFAARVWETSTGHCMATLVGHSNSVLSLSLSLSEDGTFIVSGSRDGASRLWDSTSGHCLDTSTKFSFEVTSVKFYSLNPLLIQVQVKGEIHYWAPSIPSFNISSSNITSSFYQHQPKPLYSIEDRRVMTARDMGQTAIPIWWLPPSFSLKRSDLHGSKLVIGGAQGEVLILKLPTSLLHS